MNIVGISGKARVGKDTLGRYIIEEFINKHNRVFKQVAFADAVKLMCKKYFDLSDEQLWGLEKEKTTTYLKPGKIACSNNLADYWTPREIMQHIGGLFRKIDPNFWINYLYKNLLGAGSFVITDVRYTNEADFIKEHNGFLIRITRELSEDIHNMQHESEVDLDNYLLEKYDVVVDNNGSLVDLRRIASEVVAAIITFETLQKQGGFYNG